MPLIYAYTVCVLSLSTGTDQIQCDHRKLLERSKDEESRMKQFKCGTATDWNFFPSGAIIQQKCISKSPDTRSGGYTITIYVVYEIHVGLN